MDSVRQAGLPVELTLDGPVEHLAPGVDLAAYRIVQEALTNVLKHAGAVPTRVVVRYSRRRSALDIYNACPDHPVPPHPELAAAGCRGSANGPRSPAVSCGGPGRRRRVPGAGPPATRGARMTRVVIADDQELVRAGFRLILELAPDVEVVGEASDGAQVPRARRQECPDVVLMDVRMPSMDGIEATAPADRAGSMTRVLMLTTFDLDEYVYDAMRAGASGFLLKDVAARGARRGRPHRRPR